MSDSRKLTESVCVVITNAVTTWLAILGYMQPTEKAYLLMRLVDETPKLNTKLSFNDEASGRDLRKASNLMLRDQTKSADAERAGIQPLVNCTSSHARPE